MFTSPKPSQGLKDRRIHCLHTKTSTPCFTSVQFSFLCSRVSHLAAAADVIGRASPTATVTVNGASASRQGDYFHKEVAADNTSGPARKLLDVADGTITETGAILIPPASQSPQYDADGNLSSDGIHEFFWDAENRLIKIETLASAVTAGLPYRRVECVYDSGWRRVERLLFDQPSATAPVEATRYLWAGWRCLAELNATDTITKTFVWGLDSSQALHLGDSNGALLWPEDHTINETQFFHYDGNGNVVGLSNASGEFTAEYLYSAFGELIGKHGTYADSNDYRFSTKPFEEVGSLYYYGYRYYNPQTGRWPSRDPIGERGGVNLYGFVGNNAINDTDFLGLASINEQIDRIIHGINVTTEKLQSSLDDLITDPRELRSGPDGIGPQSPGVANENSFDWHRRRRSELRDSIAKNTKIIERLKKSKSYTGHRNVIKNIGKKIPGVGIAVGVGFSFSKYNEALAEGYPPEKAMELAAIDALDPLGGAADEIVGEITKQEYTECKVCSPGTGSVFYRRFYNIMNPYRLSDAGYIISDCSEGFDLYLDGELINERNGF